MVKDVLETAKQTQVPRGYKLDAESATILLHEYYEEPYSLVDATFRVGYSEGIKAAKRGRV